MKIAAIYARVSSEQQREANTIASQTASLIEFAQGHDLEVPKEWVFEDDGYSGATLERPGLERVRDLAAEGQIQVVLAYAPEPAEPQVRVPDSADRGVGPQRG
jgi:site-specific DNA recombinase